MEKGLRSATLIMIRKRGRQRAQRSRGSSVADVAVGAVRLAHPQAQAVIAERVGDADQPVL